MTKYAYRFLLIMFLILLVPGYLASQDLTEIVFQNQSIRDILQVLAGEAGTTVISDETVQGISSFVSPALPANEALMLFLEQEGLYSQQDGRVLRVSKINLSFNEEGLISLDADNVEVQNIVSVLATQATTTILFDALPRTLVNIHADEIALVDVLNMIIRKLPEYELESDENYLYIKLNREEARQASRSGNQGSGAVIRDGELYSVNTEQARSLDLIHQMFSMAELEYSLLSQNDTLLGRLNFQDKDFDQLLNLILEHAGLSYTTVGNLYYVYDPRQRDILAKYNMVLYRPLDHIDVKKITPLIPSTLVGSGTIKNDEANNALVLYGTIEELGPLQDFVDVLDRPQNDRDWIRFELDYLEPSTLQSILPPEISMLDIIPIPESSSIIVSTSSFQRTELSRFLDVADRSEEGRPVRLRYIKADDLIENLPPSFSEEDVTATQDPSLVFFQGSDDKFTTFTRMLDTMDLPVPQIRYDLLVINYQDTEGFDWDVGASFGPSDPGDATSFTGSISPLMDLSFDITSAFGYQFALKLSTSIEETKSKVVADTTLNGLSGERISFRNTNTYRYRDYRLDPVTGDPVAEGSREITSGLFIDIEGWVSGDGMITMDISATISRQQAGSDSSDDVLPPTTERVIDTHVRSSAGSPVIISGLTQQDIVITEQRTPGLGKIPLLGWLFKKKVESIEETELIIYIVPHIEYDRNDSVDAGGLFERMYIKYVKE